MDYSALTTSLAEGKLDFGMAALCATDERKAVMQFSNTYCDSGQVVMINKETSPSEITDIDTLIDGDYTKELLHICTARTTEWMIPALRYMTRSPQRMNLLNRAKLTR